MGSGSSHHVGSSSNSTPQTPKVNRTKQRLASLFCGASQKEDCGDESLVNSSYYCQRKANNRSLSPTNDSIPTSSTSGLIVSSESSSMSSENVFIGNDPQVESSTNKRKCFLEGDESVCHGINDERKLQDVSVSSNGCTTTEIHDLVNDMPLTSQDVSPLNGLQHEEPEQPAWLEPFTENIGSPSSESEGIREPIPELEPLVPEDRPEDRPVDDAVSISSNLLPTTNNEISSHDSHEARRNSRRLFWDAFSSRSSRRQAEFPAILFTTEGSDLMRSHRRWLLDLGDDFFDDGVNVEPWRFARRSRFTSDRRRSSRSEYQDRLRGVGTESSHRTTCPLDLHSDGSCTCELDEEASALSSISRIILLAEALFEVLDEIHRQPESLSLSMLSVPAPESIVDSLPLKTYEKPSTVDDGDVDQCYICLVEYEKGDRIRLLPCHHSYHMSCVDKWLKEIHGVCPLCRGDVQQGAREAAASSSDPDIS